MSNLEDKYQMSVSYRYKYKIRKEEWGTIAECQCEFLDWAPMYSPFDDLSRYPRLKDLTIQKCWDISEKQLKKMKKHGEAYLTKELLSILQNSALNIIIGFICTIGLKKDSSNEDIPKEIRKEIQNTIASIFHPPLFKTEPNPYALNEPVIIDTKPKGSRGNFIDPFSLFEYHLKGILEVMKSVPFMDPAGSPYNYEDLEDLAVLGRRILKNVSY